MNKAKYSRRTGTPGNYRYFYDQPGAGPQQGGGGEEVTPTTPTGRIQAMVAALDTSITSTKQYSMGGRAVQVVMGQFGPNAQREAFRGKHYIRVSVNGKDMAHVGTPSEIAAWVARSPTMLDMLDPSGSVATAKLPKPAWEKSMNPLDLVKGNVSVMEAEELMKGRALPEGSVRTHGGRQVVKRGGKWVPHSAPQAGPRQGGSHPKPKPAAGPKPTTPESVPRAYHQALSQAHEVGFGGGVRSILRETAAGNGIAYGPPMEQFIAWAEKRLGLSKGAGDDEVEATEDEDDDDPAAAEAEEEEMEKGVSRGTYGPGRRSVPVEKAQPNLLDLVKADLPAPATMRIGSVTYHNQPAAQLDPIGSRPSMRKAAHPVQESVVDDSDPLALVRMADGTLTHPNGKRRIDG